MDQVIAEQVILGAYVFKENTFIIVEKEHKL